MLLGESSSFVFVHTHLISLRVIGMVFVVSFSSCLDVAAISMDMGEALDVNNELMTVGISNCKHIGLLGYHKIA